MDPFVDAPLTVSNLTPVWEGAATDGGGSFAPRDANGAVERAIGTRVLDMPRAPLGSTARRETRDGAVPTASVAVAVAAPAASVTTPPAAPTPEVGERLVRPVVALDEVGPVVDFDDLRRRDITRELLRARLVAIAEQRDHRSAYEIAFILLAASVAVLLAAPPLVQVLLAARGIQA